VKLKKFPLLLSLSIGYISLSQEILWIRVFGFTNQGLPQAFAAVLALYLLGIALGAMIGKSLCARFLSLYSISGTILIASGAFDILAPFIYGHMASTKLGLPILSALILLTALNKSILFPIAHHLGTIGTGNSIGGSVSKVYFFNVMGSALGPIVTGFILLDYFSVHTCMMLMGAMTIVVGILCLLMARIRAMLKIAIAVAMVPVVVVGVKPLTLVFPTLSTQIALATTCTAVKQVIENKHGIIHVCPSDQGDIIFGGNVYDGRINISPVNDSNGIKRLIILSALHAHPKRILMIGLSGGAWLSALTHISGIEKIDVVEINPGYLEVIANYEEISRALQDPRIRLHIDDGRRWLARHQENKYDLVVMNNSFHWRSNATNLLSMEFLSEVKTHMEKDAILAFNSTRSVDAFYTASVVFPFAYDYDSFVYASRFDFRAAVDSKRSREKIAQIFNSLAPTASPEQVAKGVNSLVTTRFDTIDNKTSEIGRSPELVTDRNMITEYKYGKLGEYLQRYDNVWSFLTCMTCKKTDWARNLK